MNKLTIHADDFGISKVHSNTILACIEHGAINSVSIIVTTDVDRDDIAAISSYGKNVALRLHVNLVEGKPLLLSTESPLVDDNGEFKYNFAGLLIKYYTSPAKTRIRMKNDLRSEIIAQVEKYVSLTGLEEIALDGHMHFHMLPFIFRIILSLSEKYNITFIRMSGERLRLTTSDLRNYLSLNIIKVLVLNTFSFIDRRIPDYNNVSEQNIVGILNTGRITLATIKLALRRIPKGKNIEIIFHPAGVNDVSQIHWTSRKTFHKFYTSDSRQSEMKLLQSDTLREVINAVNLQ